MKHLSRSPFGDPRCGPVRNGCAALRSPPVHPPAVEVARNRRIRVFSARIGRSERSGQGRPVRHHAPNEKSGHTFV